MIKNIPLNEQLNKMSRLLSSCSDKTRLKILFSLIDESKCSCGKINCDCAHCTCHSCMIEKSVSEIYLEIGASQSLVSHQLKVLKDIDVVGSKKEKTTVYYFLKDGHVKELLKVAYEHIMEDEKHD